MGDRTGISWTDATWNPIRGCSRVSAGCVNCYAESVAHRFNAPGLPYEGLTTNGRWNGTVRLVPDHLADPLRWQKPRKIFVNSMSDLFHESLDEAVRDLVFASMALAPHHSFQVLTKRPALARSYLWNDGDGIARDEHRRMRAFSRLRERTGAKWSDDAEHEANCRLHDGLPNLWLGVSVEDQATADRRIPMLIDTPAAVRFVSYEPALGPVRFAVEWLRGAFIECRDETQDEATDPCNGCPGWSDPGGDYCGAERGPRLDWIIVGGESGKNARPFDEGWARSTVDQCQEHRVACFVKQLGASPFTRIGERTAESVGLHTDKFATRAFEHGITKRDFVYDGQRAYLCPRVHTKHKAGADPAEWTPDLRVQEFPR